MPNKTLTVVKKEASTMQAQVDTLKITNAEQMSTAAHMLSTINKQADKVQAEKEKVTKPLLAALNAERGRWKPFEIVYEGLRNTLRAKMTKYQTESTRVAEVEANKIANRVGEGKGKLKVETAVKKMGEIQKPEEVVTTEAGLVKFKTVNKFEVTDFAALPDTFKVANDVEIRKAMLAGVKIKGVRYFTEQVPVNFR